MLQWLRSMMSLDLSLPDSKRMLVDTFLNSIYLYDDKLVIGFNCKEEASSLAFSSGEVSACRLEGEPITDIPLIFR